MVIKKEIINVMNFLFSFVIQENDHFYGNKHIIYNNIIKKKL